MRKHCDGDASCHYLWLCMPSLICSRCSVSLNVPVGPDREAVKMKHCSDCSFKPAGFASRGDGSARQFASRYNLCCTCFSIGSFVCMHALHYAQGAGCTRASAARNRSAGHHCNAVHSGGCCCTVFMHASARVSRCTLTLSQPPRFSLLTPPPFPPPVAPTPTRAGAG